MQPTARFMDARNQLLRLRNDLGAARSEFLWPRFERFNWVRDYFDVVAETHAAGLALRLIDDAGTDLSLSYQDLSRRSCQVAAFLAAQGVGRGDRVLIMLGNSVALWETMLAAIRLGAVMIPSATLLDREELRDRIERGHVKAIVAHAHRASQFAGLPGAPVRISVDAVVPGWVSYEDSREAPESFQTADTRANDVLLLYFTSGTTARPKLVAHTHASYPIGHLSTMYWLGLQPGDVHLNLSSPGWAKHAWSCFFAPWNAQATILAYAYERFDPRALLDHLVHNRVTTFCAPPTVWRMLIQHDLRRWPVGLREATSAGEPLNSEVIGRVREAWGITIRDGFGQTETTAQIGNPPGQPLKPGSMGRPLPGYPIVLLSADGREGDDGEICIDLKDRPVGVMKEYLGDAERTAGATSGGYYHTGDVASRDAEGYLTYVGRLDDVFKSSDYRISPFELESVLLEHRAVVEAAVVPSPDSLRLSVPKAFIMLAAGATADASTATSILQHVRGRVAPYKRIRRVEFGTLPKTASGKIRRVDLRQREWQRPTSTPRHPNEFWEEDLPALAPQRPRSKPGGHERV